MAVLVFSGGHTLKVPGGAASVADGTANELGVIVKGWHAFASGDATVLVNGEQIACIIEDEVYDVTFPSA